MNTRVRVSKFKVTYPATVVGFMTFPVDELFGDGQKAQFIIQPIHSPLWSESKMGQSSNLYIASTYTHSLMEIIVLTRLTIVAVYIIVLILLYYARGTPLPMCIRAH